MVCPYYTVHFIRLKCLCIMTYLFHDTEIIYCKTCYFEMHRQNYFILQDSRFMIKLHTIKLVEMLEIISGNYIGDKRLITFQ